MTNDKDLFSQINDLFEDVTVDQASDLIGEKLKPKQSDYERELIEKLNNNEFQLDDALVEEISNNIEKGGEVDRTLTQYLREKFGLAEPQAGQEYIVEDVLEAPQKEVEEDKPVAEDYIAQYADQLSGVIKKSQASQLRDRWAQSDDPQQRGDIYEKVEALTVQLNMLRSSLTEATMVSGIGQGGDGQTPGSGEVRINRMDDVCLGEEGIAGLKPGDVLVWDPDGRKGEGCWTPKPGDEIGTDTAAVFGKIWSCSELKEDGDLYWGTNSDYVTGVTTNLVRSGVRSIQYALSIDYDDNGGTYTGVWVAFGAVGGGVDIIPAPSTTGTSGPNGPEGFYLLGAECAGSDTTEPQVGTIHGCAEFEEAGGDLYWGTKDEMELGIGISIPTDGPVTKILEVVSTNADPVTRVGDWTCIYEYNDGSGNILQSDATVVNQKDGPNDGGFYVLNAECIDPEYPDSERPKLGFISGCKETGDAEAPIKWGNKFQAENGTGDSVTTPDTMAKEIIAVVGKEVDDAGFGTWTCLYLDSKGDALSVDYEGTSSLVGPDGFYLETDNCASDVEEPISENNPLFGIISGCDQVNDGGSLRFGTNDDYLNDAGTEVAVNAKKIWSVFSLNADVDTKAGTWTCLYQDVDDNWLAVDSSPDNDKTSPDYGFFIKGTSCDGEEGPTDGRPSGLKFGPITGCRELVTPDGPLHWGTREEYEAGAGKNTGKRAARIIFNFSVNADDTNDGTWNCLYRDVAADLQVASELGQSPEYGFFISGNDCKEDGTIDGELGPVLGGSHGCVRVIPKGVLYWGTAEDADPDDTDNVGLKIDDDVTQIIGIIGTNLYDNLYGEWRCVYKKGAGSQALVSQVQLGTNPTDSYYLIADAGGQCVEDGFNPDGPDQNKPEYGQTIGCNESTSIGPLEESNLYWADNRSAAELGNGVKKTDTNDIKKILSVFSFEEADETTGDREWTCLYQTFDNDFGYVVHTGKSPDGGFYIDTPNCATDPDIDVPGDELEPNLKFGKPVGCPVTTEDGPGNLYWSNLIATTAGENGTQIDGDGDVLKLHFSFTLDPLLRSWNLFYEKEVGTAFVRYPTTVSGESFQSWPWGYHIADGTCAVDPNPEPEPPEGNGKPVFGIITGCKKMEDTIGTAQEGGQLYFGTVDDAENEDGSGSFGKAMNDVDGDPITNAVRIISVVSFNSDNTRYGTWTCIFKDAEGKTRLAATNGRSPQQGYYLFGNQCDDDGVPGEPISCEDSADCPEGMQCVDGTCVLIPCSPDPLDPDNGICPPGLTCWQGMCFKPCTGAGDCPDGFECIEVSPGVNLCVPPGFPIVPDLGCNGDDDCPEGFHCVSGNCVQLPCDKDGVCPDGMECVFGHCYKPCDPNDPDGCPEGFRCVEVSPGLSICVIGSWPPGGGDIDPPVGGGDCTVDTDCPDGFTCVEGVCVLLPCPEGGCPPGYVCVAGHCYKPCQPDGSCPEGFNCLEVLGEVVCVPGNELPNGGLDPIGGGNCDPNVPDSCPPGYECVGGVCVILPCPIDGGGNPDCPPGFICFGGHCWPDCSADPGACPPGYECIEIDGNFACVPGGILPGGRCDNGETCPNGYECIDGICVPKPCTDGGADTDTECGFANAYCHNGFCYEMCDPALPSPCPPGFECVEVEPNVTICMPIGHGGIQCDEVNKPCQPGYICINGICLPEICDESRDCILGGLCYEGHCYKPCPPEGCPEGFTCVTIPGIGDICMPIGGGGGNCEIDTDCHNGYVCIDGTCVPDRCDDGTSCKPGFHCFEGVCYPICGPGLPDCPPGHICVNIGNGISICMPGGGAGCTEDNHCPPGFICDDGNCVPDRCDDGTSCLPGYVCYNGVCYKPCLDGDCPPGYECVIPDPSVGPICMPTGGGGGGESELDDIYFGYLPGCKVTGDSGAALKFGDATVPAGDPIVNAIVDAKAIIFTFAIDDGTPNTSYDPSTGIGDWTCVYTNAAAQIKSTTQLNAGPSPEEGFYIDTANCTDTDPDQPAPDPTRVDTTPIGCREANPSATLKWGTVQDTVDGTGTDIIDTDVEAIIYTGYENLYTNDYADQIVIYRKAGVASLKTATIFRQNPLAGVEYGFYLDVVESGAECVFSGEEHNPYLGAIVGCREVSRDGDVYWGERTDYLNLIGDIDDTSTTPAVNLGVRAKLIIAVVSTDADDTGLGNWDINYQTLDNQIGTVTVFGRSGNLGPQGAFILPTEDSVCLTEADEMVRKIYTDEVILRKIDNLNDDATTIRALRGGNPIGPFDHQDDANTVFSQEIAELNRRKPTMIVAEFTGDDDTEPDYSVEGVPQLYLPQTGDLWLDTGLDPDSGEPTYTLRAAISDRTNLDVHFPDRNDIVTEWKVISGAGGEGGANTTREVYLIRTVELYQNLQALKPDMTAEEFEAMFNLVTQEDLNILNAELFRDLHIKKPTIHVTDDIHQIPNYVPMTGDLWVNSINYRIYVCHRNEELIPGPRTPRPINDSSYVTWIELGAGGGGEGGGNNIILSPNQPASAGRADLWIDENTYYVYVWQGSTWVALTGDLSAMGKQFKVHMGPEAPTGDELYVGKLWFDTEMSEMRVYYDNKTTGTSQNRVWIPVFNPGVDPQKIESDQTVRELQDQLQAMSARIALLEANNPGTGQYDNVSDDPSGINPYA